MNDIEIIKKINLKADTKTKSKIDDIIRIVFDNIRIEYEGLENDFTYSYNEEQRQKILIEINKILEE